MNWTRILQDEARQTDVIIADQFAQKYELSELETSKVLSRQKARGLIDVVTHKVYVNKFATDFSPRDFVNILRPDSYISLDSGLNHWGISTQSPIALTCVTTGSPREYRNHSFAIAFRRISPKLFWGFTQRRTRYAAYKIAEPEKALLDWVYLSLQKGLNPSLDELDLKLIEKKKVVEYSQKYPSTVRLKLLEILSHETFAA
jgi:predicted transcriptional regulator of viral defense system